MPRTVVEQRRPWSEYTGPNCSCKVRSGDRIPNKLAGLIDITLTAADPYRGQAIFEIAGAIKLRVNRKFAGLVDIAKSIAGGDQREPFGEFARIVELRVNH